LKESDKLLRTNVRGFAITNDNKKPEKKNWGTEEIMSNDPPFDINRFSEWKKHVGLICFYQDLSHYGDLRVLLDIPYDEIFGTIDFPRYIQTSEIIETVYKESAEPENVRTKPDELNAQLIKDPHWVDSIKMAITITYPENIKVYTLSKKEKSKKTDNGIIEIRELKDNYALVSITGTLGNNFVDMEIVSPKDNYINTNYTINRMNFDTPKESREGYATFNETIYGTGNGYYSPYWVNILEDKYKSKEQLMTAINLAAKTVDNPEFGDYFLYTIAGGNIKELKFYIAERYRTETLEITIPNRSDEL